MDRLFVYHIFGTPPQLKTWLRDPASYELEVRGLTEHPLDISLEVLRTDYEAVERDVVLQCMTNVHWGRIRVRGVRLADIVARAGTSPGAEKLLIRGGDGFTSDLWLREILASPEDFLLAYEINGHTVDPDHGYPLRVVSETRYGYKWCKWVVSIEFSGRDALGHYEGKRGWSDEGLRGRPIT